jgi:DNA processing protein
MALEQGKDVYVVPGRLTDPLSTGCNRMIGQGAEIIYNIEETIWEIAGRSLLGKQQEKEEAVDRNRRERKTPDVKGSQNQRKENKKGTDVCGLLHDILDFTPKSVDEIQEEIQKITHVSHQELCSMLMTLELSGFAGQSYGRYFRRG